ncbi:hypothetical protein JVW08_20375, partial [Vibrio cholerae O1]|uniref:hypothetical protein n=1 Tax=Vibrio cholerae TaxID=666 RepID=UPI001C12714D
GDDVFVIFVVRFFVYLMDVFSFFYAFKDLIFFVYDVKGTICLWSIAVVKMNYWLFFVKIIEYLVFLSLCFVFF